MAGEKDVKVADTLYHYAYDDIINYQVQQGATAQGAGKKDLLSKPEYYYCYII